MDGVQKDGFDFVFDPGACETCSGLCCSGASGNVWVSHQEMVRICSFLQMHFIDFRERYLRRVENRYCLQERIVADAMECIFFDGNQKKCSIYALRPSGCRSYPFWDHFKSHPEQLIKECPGVRGKKGEQGID